MDFPIGAQPNTRTVAPNLVFPIACSRAAGDPVQSITKSKVSSSISLRAVGEITEKFSPEMYYIRAYFQALLSSESVIISIHI